MIEFFLMKKLMNEKDRNVKGYYSNLKMKSITDDDQKHAKLIWKEFGSQNLGQYHELYVESDTMLLADFQKQVLGKL